MFFRISQSDLSSMNDDNPYKELHKIIQECNSQVQKVFGHQKYIPDFFGSIVTDKKDFYWNPVDIEKTILPYDNMSHTNKQKCFKINKISENKYEFTRNGSTYYVDKNNAPFFLSKFVAKENFGTHYIWVRDKFVNVKNFLNYIKNSFNVHIVKKSYNAVGYLMQNTIEEMNKYENINHLQDIFNVLLRKEIIVKKIEISDEIDKYTFYQKLPNNELDEISKISSLTFDIDDKSYSISLVENEFYVFDNEKEIYRCKLNNKKNSDEFLNFMISFAEKNNEIHINNGI